MRISFDLQCYGQSVAPDGERAMKAILAIMLVAVAGGSMAQDWVVIPARATVREFAEICDTRPTSENRAARLSACGSYIQSAKHQVALARDNSQCYLQLDEPKSSLLAVSNAMFEMAKEGDMREQQAAWLLRLVLMTAAPACTPR